MQCNTTNHIAVGRKTIYLLINNMSSFEHIFIQFCYLETCVIVDETRVRIKDNMNREIWSIGY
jgi:hypothetical protein